MSSTQRTNAGLKSWHAEGKANSTAVYEAWRHSERRKKHITETARKYKASPAGQRMLKEHAALMNAPGPKLKAALARYNRYAALAMSQEKMALAREHQAKAQRCREELSRLAAL
jgi:hypothetical protein